MNLFRRPKPQPNAVDFRRLQELNAEVDRSFDAALEACETAAQAHEVERQRAEAHGRVGQAIMQTVLDGWR